MINYTACKRQTEARMLQIEDGWSIFKIIVKRNSKIW
jgi:hypothetical protein